MSEGTELQVYQAKSTSLAMPEMDVQTAVDRFRQLGQFVSTIMRQDTDFGIIPGTKKPTLLKPGAEKLCTFFGLTKEETILDKELDWTGKNHGGEPFFYFHYQIKLSRNGVLVAEADGSANSWESKHRYRQGEFKCPNCGKETIRRNKTDKGGGFYCWSKLGGCGSQFKADDTTIISQDVGKKKNPDPADLVNTIQKTAYKRALVAVTLVAVNASEYFTQDIEDLPEFTPAPEDPTPTPTTSPSPKEPSRGAKGPSKAKPEKTIDERRELASEWLKGKNISIQSAQNYLRKSYGDWDAEDLEALKEWGRNEFKIEEEE